MCLIYVRGFGSVGLCMLECVRVCTCVICEQFFTCLFFLWVSEGQSVYTYVWQGSSACEHAGICK